MVKVGDKAPEFDLVDEDGKSVKLSQFKGKNVVLAFYPFDFSPVCTNENTCFSNDLPKFADKNTVVLGISADSHFTHKAWKEKLGIKHTLLADRNLEAGKAYGLTTSVDAKKFLGTFDKRATVIVDKSGTVKYVAEHSEARKNDDILKELAKLS
ncbi:MAG TPA: redoxin domain-containing protein [Planctomycetota bacterium]|nr:redoxin domain-containing protein [Planctomycetota bacterium]